MPGVDRVGQRQQHRHVHAHGIAAQYNRVYTVTLTTGITDEEDNPITAEKVWSFKTFGEFPEPIAANNRIDAANDHTLIFIPSRPPSRGATPG